MGIRGREIPNKNVAYAYLVCYVAPVIALVWWIFHGWGEL
jgi:hypothetical protein